MIIFSRDNVVIVEMFWRVGAAVFLQLVLFHFCMLGGTAGGELQKGAQSLRYSAGQDPSVRNIASSVPDQSYYLDEVFNNSLVLKKERPSPRIDNARTQGARTGTCFQCTTLSEEVQADPSNYCFNIAKYQKFKEGNYSLEPEDVSNTLVAKCKENERYCQVRRVDYKVDDGEMKEFSQWSIERGCAEECQPFCVTMGGRTKVTYCTSCCRWDGGSFDKNRRFVRGERSDNCNVGNCGFPSFTKINISIFLILLLLCLHGAFSFI